MMLESYRYVVGLNYLSWNLDLLFYSVGCILWCNGALYSLLGLSKRVPWSLEERCGEKLFSLDSATFLNVFEKLPTNMFYG